MEYGVGTGSSACPSKESMLTGDRDLAFCLTFRTALSAILASWTVSVVSKILHRKAVRVLVNTNTVITHISSLSAELSWEVLSSRTRLSRVITRGSKKPEALNVLTYTCLNMLQCFKRLHTNNCATVNVVDT